jgi:hypothetical protein
VATPRWAKEFGRFHSVPAVAKKGEPRVEWHEDKEEVGRFILPWLRGKIPLNFSGSLLFPSLP